MGYLFLILTIITESVAVIFMKLSNGFQNKVQAGVAIIAYILSFVFLTYALKYLPVGIANAVWAGASTVLVAVLGILVFKEQLSIIQVVFLSLIIIGLAGLNFSKLL
ncbi:MAG: multidrug efflux SMR transporter [Bacteroidetes bacterium]|nr:multidrug efflux SMR transporter [Bacteroidota bacterium]